MQGCGPGRRAFLPWSRSREAGRPAWGCEEAAVGPGQKGSDFLRLPGPTGSFSQAASLFLSFPAERETRAAVLCVEHSVPALSGVLTRFGGGGPYPGPDTPLSFCGAKFLRSWKEKLNASRETFYPLAKKTMLKYSVHVLNVTQPFRALSRWGG